MWCQLFPVFHAFFGVPTVDSWFVPFGLEKAWVGLATQNIWSFDFFGIEILEFLLHGGGSESPNSSYFCFDSVPFSRDPFGFVVVVMLSFIICFAVLMMSIAFSTIYISICANIEAIIDEMASIIAHANSQLKRDASIKRELKVLIELHLKCYR